LERQQQQRVQDRRNDDQQRQPPVVDHHDGEHQGHLGGADQHPDAAPLHEPADLVDVGGHPGDQRAPLLGRLVQHRQVVDVPEGADTQARERGLDRRTSR
jgi:hypothetical protein